MADAIEDIRAERERQISEEGWTPEHDDEHADGSLAFAAVSYGWAAAANIRGIFPAGDPPPVWPDSWDKAWWKPKGRRRDLVRAGALIVAEIERLDRAATKGGEA